MKWQQWVFVAIALLSAVSVVSSVGKPRGPLEAKVAAGVVVLWAFLVGLVVTI